MNTDTGILHSSAGSPQFTVPAAARPFAWLAAGAADLARNPAASLGYGALVTALGLVLLVIGSAYVYLLAAAVSGFLLVGPVMSTGVVELSRRQAAGEAVDFDRSLDALSLNREGLLHFAAVLLGAGLAWFLVSDLILRSVLGSAVPSLGDTLWSDLVEVLGWEEILVYLGVGAVFAIAVFVVSVITVPALVDRRIGARAAMSLSVSAVAGNAGTMAVWSTLIVVLTAIGFATCLLGMIVVYPLLGHATWHAYRDLAG